MQTNEQRRAHSAGSLLNIAATLGRVIDPTSPLLIFYRGIEAREVSRWIWSHRSMQIHVFRGPYFNSGQTINEQGRTHVAPGDKALNPVERKLFQNRCVLQSEIVRSSFSASTGSVATLTKSAACAQQQKISCKISMELRALKSCVSV